MLVNFGGETAVQNERCSTHRVEVGDREHHRNGKKDIFLRSQHQEPRTLFGEFGFWILFFVNLVTSQPKWYFTWGFVKWSLSMLAGVITILQCMIYFILSFFFFLILEFVWTEKSWVYVPSVFLNIGDSNANLCLHWSLVETSVVLEGNATGYGRTESAKAWLVCASGQQFRGGASEQEFGTGDLRARIRLHK